MKTIGKYQVLNEIGASVAGTTYLARDTFRNREIALKVLTPFVPVDAEWKDRFCGELAASAELRHPHIVKVHDLGEVDGAIYVASELLHGVDLRRHLEERRALPLCQKLELMSQVCDGLALAHSKGIAHGNIKPGNIFVVAGKDARILDFGIGRWLESIIAADGPPAGLLANYLAPEQILGQPFDARADLFSVAMVLYELLVDKYPFLVPAGLIPREIVHSDPESVRKLDPGIPEELERLLVRALNKNPEQRLQTADEFAAGLYAIAQQLRDGQSAPASAISSTPLAGPPAEIPATAPETPQPVVPAVTATAETIPIAKNDGPPPAPVDAPPVTTAAPAPPAAGQVTPQPAPPGPPPAAGPVPPATVQTPQQRSKLAPKTKKRSHFRIRLITYTAAAVLTVCIIGVFQSRQSMHASQTKSQAPAVQPKSALPKENANAAPERPASNPADAVPASVTPAPQPPPEQAMFATVKTLWESGQYALAMESVNAILVANPANAQARAWKKKIRTAQDAEAALK